MKQNIFLFLFFGAFILVGLGLVGYGFARLAIYRLAEPTEATVLSAEYDAKGAIVSFSIERDGKEAIVRAALRTTFTNRDGKGITRASRS